MLKRILLLLAVLLPMAVPSDVALSMGMRNIKMPIFVASAKGETVGGATVDYRLDPGAGTIASTDAFGKATAAGTTSNTGSGTFTYKVYGPVHPAPGLIAQSFSPEIKGTYPAAWETWLFRSSPPVLAVPPVVKFSIVAE